MDLSELPVGEGVRRRLASALRRPSHATILSGPPGSGKHALAGILAAACVCTGPGDKPCGVCPGCKKARGGIHPDIAALDVPEGKQSITVEQVRRLRADAYIKPNEAPRKVFLIDHAQAMNDSAQNALLKVLEDGPGYLSFVLLCGNAEQLLPTIRSRCEVLSLVPLPGEEESPLSGELREKASAFAALLAADDELSAAEFAAGLEREKLEKDVLPAFLAAVEDALRPALRADPARVLPRMERLRQARLALPFHVGAGHLLGALAAGSYWIKGDTP